MLAECRKWIRGCAVHQCQHLKLPVAISWDARAHFDALPCWQAATLPQTGSMPPPELLHTPAEQLAEQQQSARRRLLAAAHSSQPRQRAEAAHSLSYVLEHQAAKRGRADMGLPGTSQPGASQQQGVVLSTPAQLPAQLRKRRASDAVSSITAA